MDENRSQVSRTLDTIELILRYIAKGFLFVVGLIVLILAIAAFWYLWIHGAR